MNAQRSAGAWHSVDGFPAYQIRILQDSGCLSLHKFDIFRLSKAKKQIIMKINALTLITTLIVAGLMLTSCGSRNAEDGLYPADIVKNPNTASGKSDAGDMPVLEFEKDFHDFGRIIQGEKVSYSFKFTNSGKSDLIISKVSTSCGCTVPEFPKTPVRPGESNKIAVKFDSENRRGFQNKSITIISNTQPNAVVLRIKAQVVLPEEIN